ncbi:MAG: N-acetylneuraminate synthase family protein [Bacteroidota bacterium]
MNNKIKRQFKIGSKTIGKEHECFVIAEAGVNHNGDLNTAIKLVDVAADADADAVKFQTFQADEVATKHAEMTDYQKINTGRIKSQRLMLRDLELPERFYEPIISHCLKRKIIFLSTPHGGIKSINFLESLGIEAYKIGSADLTNFLLLDKIVSLRKPMILSTGMADLNEVLLTMNHLGKKGASNIAFLHCTNHYPCPLEEVNLLAMQTMIESLNVPVGYSDHTIGFQTAIMAVTLGASIYECHFTLDRSLPGPDHLASAEPEELKNKIGLIRKIKKILGKNVKKPTKYESKKMIPLIRKSLVVSKDLTKGHLLKAIDLASKRPGDGLSPSLYEKLIGKRTIHNFNKDDQIFLKDLK